MPIYLNFHSFPTGEISTGVSWADAGKVELGAHNSPFPSSTCCFILHDSPCCDAYDVSTALAVTCVSYHITVGALEVLPRAGENCQSCRRQFHDSAEMLSACCRWHPIPGLLPALLNYTACLDRGHPCRWAPSPHPIPAPGETPPLLSCSVLVFMTLFEAQAASSPNQTWKSNALHCFASLLWWPEGTSLQVKATKNGMGVNLPGLAF